MRVTTSMMMDSYMRSLNGNSEQLSTDTERLSSGRAYLRASENPVNAARMISTNHQIKTISAYQEKVSSTTSWLSQAESTVKSVNSSILTAVSSALQTAASTATNSSDENTINGQALESSQQNLLTSLNATQGSQYVFGGSTSGDPPFKVGTEDDYNNYLAAVNDTTGSTTISDANDVALITKTTNSSGTTTATTLDKNDIVGKLMYLVPATGKYVPVSQISTDSSATISTDSSDASYYNINNSGLSRSMKVDLGLGVQMSGGTIQSGTALDAFTNPLSFLLLDNSSAEYNTYTKSDGTTKEVNNIYDDLTVTADALEDNDTSTVSASMKLETAMQSKVSLATAAIGQKSSTLSYLSDKFTTDNETTTSRLSDLEDLDTIAGYGTYSLHMAVYQASLAISNTILQNNLTNYLK